jgi:glycosyltransferase involved in cell wall biosynthesis
MPALSVLLPVHNAMPWLPDSLRSLWRQSFADFEVIAVDDGSTDDSAEALERAARREPRLRVVRGGRRGLPFTLNAALDLARAPLIARHDADDLSHRLRFESQVDLLTRDPGVAVAGSRLRMFPREAVGAGMRRWQAWHNSLLDHDAIVGELLIDSPLAHGTAILRREWLDRVGGWNERGWAEDLDLWIRLHRAGARFAKHPALLYGWRQHRTSATRRDPRYRRERFIELKIDALENGLLLGAGSMSLVGVGDSLARCVPVFRERRNVSVIEAGRPSRPLLSRLRAPIVLVFMSPVARARWRDELSRHYVEHRDFVFIA